MGCHGAWESDSETGVLNPRVGGRWWQGSQGPPEGLRSILGLCGAAGLGAGF